MFIFLEPSREMKELEDKREKEEVSRRGEKMFFHRERLFSKELTEEGRERGQEERERGKESGKRGGENESFLFMYFLSTFLLDVKSFIHNTDPLFPFLNVI